MMTDEIGAAGSSNSSKHCASPTNQGDRSAPEGTTAQEDEKKHISPEDEEPTKRADESNAVNKVSEHNGSKGGQSPAPGDGVATATDTPLELDDFGLPIRPRREPVERTYESSSKADNINGERAEKGNDAPDTKDLPQLKDNEEDDKTTEPGNKPPEHRASDNHTGHVSEWSHQHLNAKDSEEDHDDDIGWQDMPALGPLDVYDDFGRLVARGGKVEDDSEVYQGLGGAGKGYTRVQVDEDAQSVTSMDDETNYLFKEQGHGVGFEEELRDPLEQLQATKDLLTEGQRIAYVGVTRLTIFQMAKELDSIVPTKGAKKCLAESVDSINKWGQQMMIRLYAHMDIDSAEQVMIEQLAEHGVQPADLIPPLMQNARVKNPVSSEPPSSRPSTSTFDVTHSSGSQSRKSVSLDSETPSSPPPYEDVANGELPEVRTPSQLPSSKNLDIDLRWTVLCDLFLVLISDATYDARSRRLLEQVAAAMDVSWVQICRFEKRVIDALEMQEEANKETWDEAEHMENRRKMALKKRYMVMGLATVGGGLVIGLSAGLLAPVIGAGLAAGFTTIGVSGTSAFLGGVGGTALITSGATLTGSAIGIKASHRRTGAVKTFEYRPLHNNKRLNLIVTVSGWMNGKVDDVRLPYSTVDPIMGDIYSVLWEPEMLQSMGDTINILATEALTQGLQQVLGSTVLVALMASLQLPIVLTKLSYLIDNPWNVSLGRANSAGLILADSLMARNLGKRPITLLGFSLGSRVIFSCLKELAKHGAFGLIQNVYLFGSPIVANKDEYLKARAVVSGRFVNGYASNDWILGYLFRATSGGIMRVAGLAPVEGIPGLENIDVTQLVNGHMAYRAAMPRLLREVGWEVESDEFTEIEDPDPDNHQERQRELIREIDEARRQAEEKPDKKRFGFFKRGKLAEKKGWETYDVDRNETDSRQSTDDGSGYGGTVLFDIDAIRAELESEQMEVKQLETTLPPMKLDLNSPESLNSPSQASQAASNAAAKSSASLKSPTNYKGSSSVNLPSPSTSTSKEKDVPYSPHSADDNFEMTFDTAYHTPPKRSPISPLGPSESDVFGGTPKFGSTLSLSHNAWADDDHDDNKEKDITLSFE